jgi:hypothetical protein
MPAPPQADVDSNLGKLADMGECSRTSGYIDVSPKFDIIIANISVVTSYKHGVSCVFKKNL